jgi:hypothetical protein
MFARLRFSRAVLLFLLGYVLVTILAIALAMSVEAIMQPNHTGTMVLNPAYIFSQRFYPLLNLIVWIPMSWLYFKAPKGDSDLRSEAWTLGAFWLALALIVDLVGFVLIENPISLSPYDFYVGQFPWIYLIYLVILLSPILYVAKIGSPRAMGQEINS